MQKLKDIGLRVYPYIKNKFIFTTLLFLVWMTFFDQNNFIYQIQTRLELAELKAHRDQLSQEIKESTEDLKVLQNDQALLEKFARERYLMKKEDEDIFVFVVEEE